MNESAVLANHIANTGYDDLPDHVITMTKQSILDALGVTLAAGTLGEGCQAFIDLAAAAGEKEESTILGFGTKTSALMAVLANGSMAHALDFEDVHDQAPVHPNAATIPAALAVAESLGSVDGRTFITAIALGCDLVCRLGLALDVNPLEYGWYIPPILGAFGATAAAGKLLGLNASQLLDAFSLNLCQATCSAEIVHSPDAVIRSIRDSFAAKAGVLSAQLAARGVAGFGRPFEGQAGLFSLYARGSYSPETLTNELGQTFEGANLSFKPWPSCRGTHAYIEAALTLIQEVRPKLNEISAIHININPVNQMLCEPVATKQAPTTSIDAKFSLPFTISTALHYGEVRLEHFMFKALLNSAVLETARRVTYQLDFDATLKEATRGRLQLTTPSGTYAKQIDYAYGHPQNPMTPAALISKFKDCAKHAAHPIPQKNLDHLIDLILNLEHLQDINEITTTLDPLSTPHHPIPIISKGGSS